MKTFSKVVLIAIIAVGGFLVLRNHDSSDSEIVLNDSIELEAQVAESQNENSLEGDMETEVSHEEDLMEEGVVEDEEINSDEKNIEETKMTQITLKTNKGDIKIEMFDELAPNTVANFVKLAGEDFYDGVKFHRVIEGFMIQAGDPLSKNEEDRNRWGTGGPGYQFEDEIHSENRNDVGTISMANAGPNTNGSQFFINVSDNSFLDTKHTVFGKVVEGYDIVEAISVAEKAPNDQPIEDISIEDVIVG